MGTNVFTDAGYADDDATVMAIRSDLAMRIAEYLQRRQLPQVAEARMLGVPQPTISKIKNGRIDNLSIELLLRMLVRANVPVVIQTGATVQDAGAYVAAGKRLTDIDAAARPPAAVYPLIFIDGDRPQDAETAAARAVVRPLGSLLSGVAS